jgi:hypothetical protein
MDVGAAFDEQLCDITKASLRTPHQRRHAFRVLRVWIAALLKQKADSGCIATLYRADEVGIHLRSRLEQQSREDE